MKKKALIIMALCLILLAGGCAKKPAGDISGNNTNSSNTSDSDNTTDSSNTANGSDTANGKDTGATNLTKPASDEYNVDDYIKLGQYKGVEVSVDQLKITDADVEDAVQYDLESRKTLKEVTDRDVVQDGDTVNIDYEGLKDGVAFEGGSAKAYDLEIGSGSFIPGFESGLIGKKRGDKVKLDITFPKDYSAKDLAGKAVVFNVTINKIYHNVVPELTEDYIKNNTDYDSIDAYKKSLRDNLQKSLDHTITNTVLNKILENSTISSYPEALVKYYSESYKNYYQNTVSYQYGMTLEQYIQAVGKTQEEFDADVKTVAENYVSIELVERAIAKAENITISDDDYKNQIVSFAKDYGASKEEDLLSYMTKDTIKDEMLLNKAGKFAVDNAKITENPITPTPAAAQ